MLVPLTRQTFEQLIPAVATSDQYKYYWGKPRDFLKRLLISAVGALGVTLINIFITDQLSLIKLLLGITSGLYWLWWPVVVASFRNLECRRFEYCGFWQGRVLDVFITEEIIGEEETVDERGDLIVIESLEKRINVEVGDKTGFSTVIQTTLQRSHQGILPGQAALMLVMSNVKDLSRIAKCSDIYIPSRRIWVSDYPYLQRDVFAEVANQLKPNKNQRDESRIPSRNSRRTR